ncbi:DUF4252 domain-containing protein [Lacinutrix sp. 5H-3-7-4]|uniref:DUF4252 domain-containing protein n=1 Tax=Lacinutrix sp. (strain 5H-3-7-4) TaxID=983544 RepID=UPI00020A3E55|nr:DUF4252 domain-containing protein [Lacinutrix sp. 5H-3-7-4]AEH01866.1 hypothetical protein Lacal_2020 [Lacinutrix sp. 5H-3-7-4]
MNTKFKTILAVFFLTLALVSCKDEKSIQTYVVEHQDKPEFLSLDLSPKMIDVSKIELDEDQEKVYNSFKKVNIIAYKAIDGNQEQYTQELEKAKAVFKNEKYNELMEFSDNGMKFRVNTIGDNDTVDEFLVLASSSDLGFAVVRVLGDDMQPEKLYKLISQMQNADVDESQLQKVMDYFKQ